MKEINYPATGGVFYWKLKNQLAHSLLNGYLKKKMKRVVLFICFCIALAPLAMGQANSIQARTAAAGRIENPGMLAGAVLLILAAIFSYVFPKWRRKMRMRKSH